MFRLRIVLITALIGITTARAQTQFDVAVPSASKVPAMEVQEKSKDQYANSADFWESVVKTNLLNEDAWVNLYKANLYSKYPDHSNQINQSGKKELDAILTRIASNVPGSFAFYYCSYLNKFKSDEAFGDLLMAYEKQPENAELWDDMLCNSLISDDQEKIKFFAIRLNQTGFYSPAEMEYNRNVLNSVEQNGVLITNGNSDTYPLYILQNVYGYRTDVRIICLDWLGSARFAKKAEASLLVKPGKVRMNDPSLTLSLVLAKGLKVPVYVALTLSPDEISKYQSKLYCTGLAMKYSESELANLPSLTSNWESLFRKDQIHSQEKINNNYLVPLVLLSNYYKSSSNDAAKKEVDNLALEIAARLGATSTVQALLK